MQERIELRKRHFCKERNERCLNLPSGQMSWSSCLELTKMRGLQLSALIIDELELQERVAELVNEAGAGRDAKLPLDVDQLADHQRLVVGQFADLCVVLFPL